MNIDTLLEDWQDTKQKKAIYEKKCERYRKSIEKYMNKKNLTVINGKNNTVTKRTVSRYVVSKNDLPPDIWEKYSHRTTFSSFYIKRN